MRPLVVAKHFDDASNLKANDLDLRIEAQHTLPPNEIDAIEDHLYEHNSHVTRQHDGQGLGFVIRDELGRIVGVATGYSWAGHFRTETNVDRGSISRTRVRARC
jgi:hypothetical protein